ncbi:MAG: hypothetical protein RLZZ618_3341 [Pseudomonadota bacterium]|jgi:hypothetical protein
MARDALVARNGQGHRGDRAIQSRGPRGKPAES